MQRFESIKDQIEAIDEKVIKLLEKGDREKHLPTLKAVIKNSHIKMKN